MTKVLLALLIVWAGWFLWVGPRKFRGGSVTHDRPRGKGDPAPNVPTELVEAREVLGVAADADEAAIRAAHRRLITMVHPDKGGSAELTRRVNAARDTLLKR